MTTILASLDQDSLLNLEEFLARGDREDGLPIEPSMAGDRRASVHGGDHHSSPHSRLSSPGRSLPSPAHQDMTGERTPSFTAPDFLSPNMHQHHAPLIPGLEPLPVFGSGKDFKEYTGPAEPIKRTPAKRRKSTIGDSPAYGSPPTPGSSAGDSRMRIAWTVNDQDTWHRVFDPQMNEIQQPGFRVEIDKGLKRSPDQDSFICQKKNHFQCTVSVKMQAQPAYVATREGLLKVSGLFINMYGIKTDMPTTKVDLEQSQSDRSKKAFAAVPIAVLNNEVTKLTIGRLHFAETTSNNMRKKGKPNPEQRYFSLIVTLAARAGDQLFTIASHKSQNLIVRASNPGQFESEPTVAWVKGASAGSISHHGSVGINTDSPDEALCVQGNIRLSGAILQPSDKRVKTDVVTLDSRQQLQTLRNLNLYRYQLTQEWAETCGRRGGEREDVGVLAQELAEALPDAVKVTSDVHMKNGNTVEKLLVVNKERLFMESVGAVDRKSVV